MNTKADEEMGKELNLKFAGKRVTIINTPLDRDDLEETSIDGICKCIHVNMADVEIELVDGRRFGLSPDAFFNDSIAGEVNCELRREIKLA